LHADAVLSGNGYRRLDRLPLTFWASRIHHAVYHRPATDDLIEVHWHFGIPTFFRLSSEDIWADTVRIDRMQFRLSPAMMVIHLLMHHHMHSFRELRILTDIIWALHKYCDSIEWGAFAQRLTHIGLLKTAMITLSQMKMLCKERAESETALRNFREAVEKSGHGKPVMLNRYFRSIGEKDHVFQDRRDKFMARLALDIRKKMLLSFVTALFPSPGELKNLYGDNRSRMLPRHYAKFISWRMREWMPRISSH
jgi:mRNA-degrading endonuclease HigB of HigAB toxin-antitoxin module